MIVAIPLTEVDETLDQLLLVEALVVGILLLTLTGIGWIVIRIGLRPLEQMERVAGEIADGDLSRRVTPATSRTEIGRLGLTLNKMLARIEEAFADRARSEERRKRFLSDASHELRTPLASLRGYAELFRMGPAQDPVALKRAMARIESEAARMGALVDNLLMLARLDEVPEAAARAGQPLTSSPHRRSPTPGQRPPSARSRCDDGEPLTAIGNPDGLRQVLANLMSNALTHTPEGTPVSVELRRTGNWAILDVRDHGPGLPAGCRRAGVRPILAKRRRPHSRPWRGRPGPGDRPRDRAGPSRHRRRGQCRRRGRRVHGPPAVGAAFRASQPTATARLRRCSARSSAAEIARLRAAARAGSGNSQLPPNVDSGARSIVRTWPRSDIWSRGRHSLPRVRTPRRAARRLCLR